MYYYSILFTILDSENKIHINECKRYHIIAARVILFGFDLLTLYRNYSD